LEEGHEVTPGTWSRRLIDEFQAQGLETAHGFTEVRDPIGDMMEALASFMQETSDGSLGSQRLQKLDGAHEGNPDALARKFLHRGTSVARKEFENGDRLLEGGYRHGDVVQGKRNHVYHGVWVRTIRTPEGA